MENDINYLSFQLDLLEKKITSLDEKIAFLNKLLVVVGVVMIFIYIYA